MVVGKEIIENDIPVERLAAARHELGQYNGVNMSIEVSDTFAFKNPENMGRAFAGEIGPDSNVFIYGRQYNPTVLNFSHELAAIEATETAYCTASGMAAISSLLLYLCQTGGHVVASMALYGGTYALLKNFLPKKCNINTTFVDITDTQAVEDAIVEGTTVLYFESISNPTLIVADIRALSDIAKKKTTEYGKKVYVVVDNTFTPLTITPAKLGADLVVHSLTKYFSGGADLLAGAICGPTEVLRGLLDLDEGPLMLLGPSMNPREAFELSQRLPHLALRVKAQSERALEFAQNMKAKFPELRVIYPGLKDHAQHELLASERNEGYGFGALISFDVGTANIANNLLDKLENRYNFGLVSVSLGYYENLISASGSSTASEVDQHTQEILGITEGLIRLSVGYLGTTEQKWEQFKKAYKETMYL